MTDSPEPSDLELLRVATEGDDRAFHALIDRHARLLFRVAMSLCGNRADAEDILQETFLGAYRGMHKFGGRSSVKTWLVQILTRQSHKAWHRSKHHSETLPIDSATGAHASESSVEMKMDLMQVLQTMSPEHREVIVLRHLQGLSYDEMARVLNLPQGTVESRLTRQTGRIFARG